jgi:mRNA-degrading endonuclease RelE of RelBE toxin-antitoxin system
VTDETWHLIVSGPARRAIGRIPPKVGIAVMDFLLGALINNPRRVGKPLQRELTGLYSARVGLYRVVYEIDDDRSEVRVLYIDHRADVYRPR